MNTKDINKVKLFLMDMDGTVYIGDKRIEGAFEALEKIRKSGRRICFFTNNSSRSFTAYIEKLSKIGFSITPEEIMTSGQVTAAFVKKEFPGKKVFLLGTDALYDEFKAYGVPMSYDEADLVVMGFDTALCYERLYRACRYIMEGKPYIATHPDLVCPAPLGDMPDVGSFIMLIEGATGRKPDYICGKPYSYSADSVKERFSLQPEEIAMVGDRLYTDIKFGINNGFFSLLVLTGETDKEMFLKSGLRPDLVLDTFSDVLSLLK
jgi:4-nitrophenyl phosphatase/NagD protein